jgi:pSer/pThr/pTyr-binding forkhead associated (FHA) protein
VPATTYRLTMRKGPEAGQQFSLTADTVTVGRDPVVDVVINDPEVSRQHARLIRRGDHFLIQDLGSTNGTFLDGRRLAGDPVPLAPGQMITIGSNVSLVFEAEGDVEATILAAGEPGEGEAEEESVPPGVGIFEFPEELEPVWPDEPAVPEFDRVETTPLEERDTMLDYPSPPHDLSYQEPPEDQLPDFDAASAAQPPSEPYIMQQQAQYRGTPPTPPAPPLPPRNNRTRNVVIISGSLLLLCCCCILVTYFWLGDIIVDLLRGLGLWELFLDSLGFS